MSDKRAARSGLERYRDAIEVGAAFWRALADDSEDALAPLLSPVWDGRPSGFAALYRADRALARETCRFLGLATRAELVGPDRVRFRYTITDRVLYFEAPTPMTYWRLELVDIDGRWLVDRSSDVPATEDLDLGPLFGDFDVSPPGPIQ